MWKNDARMTVNKINCYDIAEKKRQIILEQFKKIFIKYFSIDRDDDTK